MQIREWLMQEAEKDPDFRFPSERELCRLYGVSRPTVQKALSYFIENDLIVRRPGIGTMIRKGRSISPEAITAVKVVIRADWIKWEDDLYFARILAGILTCIRNNNRQLTIQQYSDKVQHLLLNSPEICSLWLSPESTEIDAMKTLAQNGHKVIAINREVDYPNISYATTDHECGGKIAVEYLLDKGHRNILYIGTMLDRKINDQRYLGYLAATRNIPARITPPPINLEKVDYADELKNKLKEALAEQQRPTALFLANGHFQQPVMNILAELDLNVNSDISVISFDDIENVSEKYGITVVRQPLNNLSRHAFEAISRREHIKEKIQPEIIERTSIKTITPEN